MNLFKLFIGICLSAIILSCSNEFEIAAPFRNIPVVYALVDTGDEFNYYRVEKAFIDSEISAEILARNPDSLYYGPEVQMRITNLRNNNSAILARVDLQDEGFTREEGPFATQPNIGYKLRLADLDLDLNDEIKFEILDVNDTVLTEATTMAIGEYMLTGQPSNPIRFGYERDVSFGIRSDEQGARFYDLRVFINYDEVNINNPTVRESKRLEWVIETELERRISQNTGLFQSQTVFRVQGIEFYRFLGNNIEENGSISRFFTGIDLQYDAGGQELFDFINIGQANTGITSGQIIPSFTNLSNDAVGIFSSRITARSNADEPFFINTESRDSLREGIFTRQLNFN